jgi:hypothetical protein
VNYHMFTGHSSSACDTSPTSHPDTRLWNKFQASGHKLHTETKGSRSYDNHFGDAVPGCDFLLLAPFDAFGDFGSAAVIVRA